MMATLIMVWRWLSSHATAVLGGIVAVLAAVIAWGSLQRRNSSLKATVRSERAQRKAAGDIAVSDDAMRRDAAFAEDDAALQRDIERAKEVVGQSKPEVSNARVVDKLNERYSSKRRR